MAQLEPAGYKREEAAKILNCSKGTVSNMERKGLLQTYNVGIGGYRGKRYTRESIDKVLTGRPKARGR